MTIVATMQIILVMVLWAACFPLITAGIEYAPHLTFAALRAVFAGLTLTGLAFALRRPLPKGLQNWLLIALVGFGATSLGFLGMFHAAELVSPGIATVITNTQPLLAAVLAGVILRERLTGRGRMALLLSFFGILLIASPRLLDGGRDYYILGVSYILLAAVGITVSNVVIKRISGRVDALMAMGLQMLIGSLPLMTGAWITEDPATIQWSSTFMLVLLALSLPGTALVYWIWFSVLERVPLNRANAFSFLIPIFGLAMGMLFYDETLERLQMAGFVLTVLGVTLITRGGIESAETGDEMQS